MTLNGLNDPFTLNFHYCNLPLLLIYCTESVYAHDHLRSTESGAADRVWNPRKSADLQRRNLGQRCDIVLLIAL